MRTCKFCGGRCPQCPQCPPGSAAYGCSYSGKCSRETQEPTVGNCIGGHALGDVVPEMILYICAVKMILFVSYNTNGMC